MMAFVRERVRIVRQLLEIFDRRERLHLLALVMMMVLGAALEVLGISVITSLAALVAKPDAVSASRFGSWFSGYFRTGSIETMLPLACVILFAIIAAKNAYLAMLVYSQARFSLNRESRISCDLMRRYLAMPYPMLLQRNSAELVRNITQEVSSLIAGILQPALIVLSEVIVLTFVFLLVAAVEPVIAVLGFGLLGSTGWLYARSVKHLLLNAGRERATSASARIRWVNQAVGSVKEIKLLGREEFFVRSFHRESMRFGMAGRIAQTINGMPRLVVETVAIAMILAAIVAGQVQGRDLDSLIPTMVLFALAAMRIMPSVNRITPAINQIRFWLPALDTVYQDLVAMPPVQAVSVTSRIDGSILSAGSSHAIETRGVTFRYPGADRDAISDISLVIPSGASVAFMGRSGSGKSTLVDILIGLLDPWSGKVHVSGRPIDEVRDVWQRRIGYVPQTIYLLDDSVRRNVAFAAEDAEIDDQRVWSALRRARIAEVVERLPGGLDGRVGERGARLSGGERQRLGIARALYYEPLMLVLDEATSALDGQTERDISETIRELHGNSTILIVAHRVSTVRHCDLVFFLAEGRVVDSGTFHELVERNLEFRGLIGEMESQYAAANPA